MQVLRGRRSSIIAALAATLALPAAADATVQEGSLEDSSSDQAIDGLNMLSFAVRHDTAGSTTVAIRFAGPPPASPGARVVAIVGTSAPGDCTSPQVQMAAVTTESGATGSSVVNSTTANPIAVSRSFDPVKNELTLTTQNAIPGGAEAGCAFVFVRKLDDTPPSYDFSDLLTFRSATPDPPPSPPTPPKQPDPPEPVKVAGPPKGAPAFSAVTKARGRSVIFGICGFSVCRVDPSNGRSTRVLRSSKKSTAYTAVSASARGTVVAYTRGGKVYRGGRNGRKAKQIGSGFGPEVRADGRTVAWQDTRQFKNSPQCIATFDGGLNCDYLTGYSTYTYLLHRASGAEEATTYTRADDYGWAGAMLLTMRRISGSANDYVCAGEPDGLCVRPVVQDAARTLTSPQGSPDGKLLVVVSEPGVARGQDKKGTGSLVLYNASSGAFVRKLTDGSQDARPMFSPDGKRVAFNRGSNLYVVSAKGGKARLVKKAFRLTGPSWALG